MRSLRRGVRDLRRGLPLDRVSAVSRPILETAGGFHRPRPGPLPSSVTGHRDRRGERRRIEPSFVANARRRLRETAKRFCYRLNRTETIISLGCYLSIPRLFFIRIMHSWLTGRSVKQHDRLELPVRDVYSLCAVSRRILFCDGVTFVSRRRRTQEVSMQRREFLTAAGTLAAIAAATAPASAQTEHTMVHGPKYKLLAEVSGHCVATGEDCLRHCYEMFSMKDTSMTECAQSVSELITTCRALQTLAASNSQYVPAFAKVVEKVCLDCKKQCDKFPKIAECVTCGESCLKCAEECRKIAA
jgi:Cys-rich four helix bundle protein (predicted Tat secretion target)